MRWHVQLEEVLERPPTLREFGRAKFEWPSAAITADIEQAWAIYQEAMTTAKQSIETIASVPSIE
jgi:hypothetical protein